MIYFLHRRGQPDLIKMGYTKHSDIEERLSGLRTAVPEGFEIIGLAPGTKEEDAAHKIRWANIRWYQDGGGQEWYRRTPEFSAWITEQITAADREECWVVDPLWDAQARKLEQCEGKLMTICLALLSFLNATKGEEVEPYRTVAARLLRYAQQDLDNLHARLLTFGGSWKKLSGSQLTQIQPTVSFPKVCLKLQKRATSILDPLTLGMYAGRTSAALRDPLWDPKEKP